MKRLLHGAGGLLAIAGVVFVVLRLHDYGAEIDFTRFNAALWSGITAFALIYGLANLMLAFGWWNLLAQFGSHPSRRWIVKTFGISQLAKYVPGNIFHLAGRQAMGMAAGIPGWTLAKSSFWELSLLSLAGALFGVLVVPFVLPSLTTPLALGAFAIIVVLVGFVVGYYAGVYAARAFVWYIGFLTVSGLLFIGLIGLLTTDRDSLPWAGLGAAYVVAWLIGMLTPGAPAGVGVREMILLFLLKGLVTEADLLLAIVLGRVVTVGGDTGFWAMASLYRPLIHRVSR